MIELQNVIGLYCQDKIISPKSKKLITEILAYSDVFL